mmetsp:Transcript_15933/g.34410  ORF Transcript_15933/g.34410 Transcript_15933/m.34410 type:complete len:188 (+) Transcript_15933:457-1020(+)
MLKEEEQFYTLFCGLTNTHRQNTLALQSKVQWAKTRIQFKRQFLYLLVTGANPATNAGTGSLLDDMFYRGFMLLDCTVDKNQLHSYEFLTGNRNKGRVKFCSKTKETLRKWFEHNAYPTEAVKKQIMQDADLSMQQVTNWFANERSRTSKRARDETTTSEVDSLDTLITAKIRKLGKFGDDLLQSLN